MKPNILAKCVIIFGIVLSASNAGFMDMEPRDLANAYIDASIDGLKPILDLHKNRSYAHYDSVKCFEQIKYFKDEAKETKMWALKVIDSWSKIPSGLMSGNIRDLGSFDQCLSIEQNSSSTDIGVFRGQYCLTSLTVINVDTMPLDNQTKSALKQVENIFPYMGLCIPDSCSPDAWESIVNSLMNKYHVKVARPLHHYCKSEADKIPMSKADIIALIFFMTIVMLMIISTYAEYNLRSRGLDPLSSIWTIFSMHSNGKAIFKLKEQKFDGHTVECINGIRAFSIIIIIYQHSFIALVKQPVFNPIFMLTWINSSFSRFMVLGNLAIDSFLLIGGFVLCYNLLRFLDKLNGRINFPILIVRRYLSIIPSLMASVLFLVTLMKHLGQGPLWFEVFGDRVELCQKHWLNTLLLIQNYASCCVEESWYLAADFQLFCGSIFLIYGVWKLGKKSVWMLIFPVVFATFYQFYVIVVNNMDPGNLTEDSIYKFLKSVYKPAYMRMGSYFIGILLALFMHDNRDKKFHWTKGSVICGWILSNIAFWISYYCIDYLMENPSGTYKFASCQVFLRVFWCINLSWIIFACHHGKGGVINRFLSYKVWQPIARLTLHMYIVHQYVILYFISETRTPFYYDNNNLALIRRFFGDLVITIIVSVCWCLAFGSPFNRLFDYLLMPSKKMVEKSVEQVDLGECGKKT